MNMGYDLMSNSIGNALGHYEDWPAVRLHERLLADSDTSWKFHDEVPLNAHSDIIQRYIFERNEKDTQWGVKDPRVCLFLPQWKQALGDDGAFLIVIRHWSSCVESLLHRESRNLAHSLNPDGDVSFWESPDLAAKMWLSYNKRLLSFIRANKSCCVVVTQRALLQGAPILQSLNRKFGFELDCDVEPPFNSSLLRDKASSLLKNSISIALQTELDLVWEKLLSQCDFKCKDEKPIYFDRDELPEHFIIQYRNACNVNVNERELVPSLNNVQSLPELSLLRENQIIDLMRSLSSTNLVVSDFISLEQCVVRNFKTNGKIWFELALIAQELGEYEKAIGYYGYASLLGHYFPYVSMQLGICHKMLGSETEAIYFYDKAISENPNSHAFYISKAECLTSFSKYESAEKVYLDAIEAIGVIPVLVQKYVDFLLGQKRENEAREFLTSVDSSHPGIKASLIRLNLLQEPDVGMKEYYILISNNIAGKDKFNWLAGATKQVTNATAEKDLLQRCLNHWAFTVK